MGLPGAAWADSASSAEELRAWLHQIEAEGAKVQMGAIEPSADGASALVRGLAIESAEASPALKWSLSVKSLSLTAASETSSAWRVGRAHAEGMRIGVGDAAYIMAGDVDLKDIALPRSAPTTLDPRQPTASLVRFLRAALTTHAGGLTFTNVSWAFPGAAPGASNTLGLLSAETLEAGSIAGLHLHDLSVSNDKAQGTTRIGDLSLQQLSPAVLVGMIDPQTYHNPGVERPWRPVVGHAKLTTLDMSAPGSHTTLQAIDFGPIEARRLSFDPTAAFDLVVTNSPKLREQPALMADLTGGFADSLKIAKASVRALASDDGAQAPLRHTQIEAMDFVDLAPRTAGSMKLRGLQTLSGEAGIGIGQIAVDDLRLGGPTKNSAAASPAAIPQFSNLALTDMILVRPGVNAALGSLKITAGDYVGATPSHLEASLEGVSVPVADMPPSPLKTNLTDLKIEQLQVSASLSADWAAASEQFDLSSARISATGLGEFSASATFTGVTRALLENSGTLSEILATAQISQARVGFRDAGLAGKVLDKFAEVNKAPVEKVRSALTANMPTIFGAIPDAASRNRLIFAAIGFLNDPKSVSVFTTITSPQPLVKVWEAIQQSPSLLPGLLKLDAVANRPS